MATDNRDNRCWVVSHSDRMKTNHLYLGDCMQIMNNEMEPVSVDLTLPIHHILSGLDKLKETSEVIGIW